MSPSTIPTPAYDVADEEGRVFAGVYLDLHARSGKRAASESAPARRARLNDGNVRRVPVAYLVCNFAPKTEAVRALLSHKEVVTFLHETGHCSASPVHPGPIAPASAASAVLNGTPSSCPVS
ncbi:M3 family metallopeptidase [Caulobacter segnis]